MFDQSSCLVPAIVATFLLAGPIKGVTGMGLPTVAMGLLGALMAPVLAAALLIVPSFVTNVWQLFAGPAVIALARRLCLMMLGIIIGTLAGSSVLAGANARWTTLVHVLLCVGPLCLSKHIEEKCCRRCS